MRAGRHESRARRELAAASWSDEDTAKVVSAQVVKSPDTYAVDKAKGLTAEQRPCAGRANVRHVAARCDQTSVIVQAQAADATAARQDRLNVTR
jgi:hypothetical protein